MENIRKIILDKIFQFKHKLLPKDFTRQRSLDFMNVFLLLLSKSAKSIQNHLNEFFGELGLQIPTDSAFVQARKKFKHTAFIELMESSNDLYYSVEQNNYLGLRLLAVDGSKVLLPNNKETKKEFGTLKYKTGEQLGETTMALMSVLYDVLNEMSLNARIEPCNSDERKLAIGHLNYCKKSDCLIFDRGYPSYQLIHEIIKRKLNFVMRCSNSTFKVVNEIFKREGEVDEIVELKRPAVKAYKNLPQKTKVRVVKILLETGEYEMLITSLFDSKFKIDDFKQMYNYRWKEEGYYEILKERLNLENFTGTSVEAIKQDFHSTIFITNIESIFVEESNKELKEKCVKNANKYEQKVNKNISFNAIKNEVYDLIFSKGKYLEEVIERLEQIFKKKPIMIRPNRKAPRKKSIAKSLKYRKCSFKFCF